MEKRRAPADVFLASCIWKFSHDVGELRGVTGKEAFGLFKKFDYCRGLDTNIQYKIYTREIITLFDFDIIKREWQKINGEWVGVYSITDMAQGLVEKKYNSMLETIIDLLDYDTKKFLQTKFAKQSKDFDSYSFYSNLEQIVNAEKFLLIKQCDKPDSDLTFKFEITPFGRDCVEKMNYQKEARERYNFEPIYFGD